MFLLEITLLFSEDKYVIEDSTEFVRDVAICGPKMPIPLKNHCFFKLNTSFALIAGGIIENDFSSLSSNVSRETIFYNILDQSFTYGPALKNPR